MSLLELKFKGARCYLQGGDLYLGLNEWAAEYYDVAAYVRHLAFRNMAQHQCMLVREPPDASDQVIANAVVKTRDGDKKIWLIESEQAVTGRYAYDEESLVGKATLDVEGDTITLDARIGFSIIEEIIALTKQLNNTLDPLEKGKWLFAQLDIDRPLKEDCFQVSIKRQQHIKGKFSVNTIMIDGNPNGKIRFIVGDAI